MRKVYILSIFKCILCVDILQVIAPIFQFSDLKIEVFSHFSLRFNFSISSTIQSRKYIIGVTRKWDASKMRAGSIALPRW